jgi:hypothetical protein
LSRLIRIDRASTQFGLEYRRALLRLLLAVYDSVAVANSTPRPSDSFIVSSLSRFVSLTPRHLAKQISRFVDTATNPEIATLLLPSLAVPEQ